MSEVKETHETTEPEATKPKRFHADMTLSEAMSMHPRAPEVFAAFHLGGCSHCHVAQIETIGEVCQGYGVDVNELLNVLESLED
jgi:hybrid cluster-associated redox disulfide protein